MFQQKSIGELDRILQSFKLRLVELDQDAVRDKNKDYSLLPSNKLNLILKSQIPLQEKKKLLLNQIGLLRINLFMEYSERIAILEKNKQLDEAVKLMNDYAESIAIPFIPIKKQPSLINRFMDLISRERPLEPHEYVQKWKNEYQLWFERNDAFTKPSLRKHEEHDRFIQIQMIFHMLYTVSFSDDNFPPSPTIILVDPSFQM